jgi:glycosyltransferase involved in cell wall biosynthesis
MISTFSIITPCYNAARWIRSCVDSVADQEGVIVQHLIQDGLSTDGTAEYVLAEPRVQAESKQDNGMYDAINQGWARATGEYVLHLNADEQLLPGALAAVGSYFHEHPDVDVIITGALMCNTDGTLQCYRKPLVPPLSILLTSHHPVLTCAIFLRRASFNGRHWLYDPGFRIVSDALLMIDIVREKKRFGLLDHFTSVYLWTGENMGLSQSQTAVLEYAHNMSLAPLWLRYLKPLIKQGFRFTKLMKGHYTHGPFSYQLYVPGDNGGRRTFYAARPSGIYQERTTASGKS